MPQVDYLIIGGGIAGTTCAETLRSKDADAKIAILDSERHTLYSKVLIPTYLKGRVSKDKLFLRSISQYQKQGIDLFTETRVAAVDRTRKEVLTKDSKSFSYNKLLVSSGGTPRKLNEVFSSTTPLEPLMMRDLDDADTIKSSIESHILAGGAKTALIVGESFIALEFMEIFTLYGFEVHLLARGKLWGGEARFGQEGSRILEENFIRHKAIIHRGAEITFIKNDEFYLKSGEHIKVPMWAAGIGLFRDFSFLPELERKKGLLCDEYLRTADPDIFVAGDAAEYFDISLKRRVAVGNWTNAFLQGRCAAMNMMSGDGKSQPFKAVPTYNIVNLGYTLTFIGLVDCDTSDEVFEIIDDTHLMRVFLEGGRSIGAVLINRFSDKITLSKIIENGYGREELEKTFKSAVAG